METTICRVLPIRQDITYWFCFTGAETEIHKIKDDSKIKREKNIDRRGQRHIVNVWHLSDPPFFSLPTTFKRFKNSCSAMHMVLVQRLQYSIGAPFLRSIVRISRIYHTRSRSAISSELETCKMFFLLPLCLWFWIIKKHWRLYLLSFIYFTCLSNPTIKASK